MSENGRPTLRDVAARAGVSIGTASSVFSRRQQVAPHTRAAVLDAASALGYRPRLRAADPIPAGLPTVALLVSAGSEQLLSPVLLGAQEAAEGFGLTVTAETIVVAETPEDLPPTVRRPETQGVLVLGALEPRLLELIVQTRIPCVLVDHVVAGLAVDRVGVDEARGGFLATEHLIKFGHRDPAPALITGPPELGTAARLAAGYRSALAAHGLSVDSDHVRQCDSDGSGARETMLELLSLAQPPTAVFCWSDLAALAAMQALQEQGVAVPQQCSVIGYGDFESTAMLSTVRVDRQLLGTQALWHLAQRIRHPDLAPRLTMIDVEVIARSSTAPAPAAMGA